MDLYDEVNAVKMLLVRKMIEEIAKNILTVPDGAFEFLQQQYIEHEKICDNPNCAHKTNIKTVQIFIDFKNALKQDICEGSIEKGLKDLGVL